MIRFDKRAMTIVVDFNKKIGPFKPLNAVNNGPLPYSDDQTWSNFDDYKKARFPYARTHDASFCARYGGEHTVDVNFIFPNFDADENDPSSYDFQLTDEYIKNILSAGAEPFFRLGSKIEHWSKKYNTLPPADFDKWARICEHIIAHYVEGWANGFRMNIAYWEIWNEPDMRQDHEPIERKPTWGGTKAQFFALYKTAACHLKNRFPQLKIGGPAVANIFTAGPMNIGSVVKPWIEEFLAFVRDNNVSLDFFSWHIYTERISSIERAAEKARETLDKYGLTRTESVLNEWNYATSFKGDDFIHSIKAITGARGAAFSAAAMCYGQNSSIDMMMYYDAQPGVFNGLFDFYTMRPLVGYYPFFMYSELKETGDQIYARSSDKDIYVLAAAGEKKAVMISYYTPPKDNSEKAKTIEIEGLCGVPEVYLTDRYHDMTVIRNYHYADGKLTVTLPPLSVLFIRLS